MKNSIRESDTKDNDLYVSGYEETALAYIKYLNEKGDATTAYEQQKKTNDAQGK